MCHLESETVDLNFRCHFQIQFPTPTCNVGVKFPSPCQIPAINIQQLFMNAIENSNGVLAARPDIADGGDATQMESQAALCYMEPDAAVVSADQRIIDLDADDAVSEPTAPIVVAAGPKERDVGTVPDSWSLGGALNVNGLKHIFSNISGDILKRWEEFSHFQEALSAINTLHYQTFYRDRLQKLMRPPMDKLVPVL